MKVLSLFDGISCGMLALKKCGFKLESYDGSTSFNALTNSKNNLDCGSSKFNLSPAKLNHVQGEPPISKSYPLYCVKSTPTTLPCCFISGKFFLLILIASLSIS